MFKSVRLASTTCVQPSALEMLAAGQSSIFNLQNMRTSKRFTFAQEPVTDGRQYHVTIDNIPTIDIRGGRMDWKHVYVYIKCGTSCCTIRATRK